MARNILKPWLLHADQTQFADRRCGASSCVSWASCGQSACLTVGFFACYGNIPGHIQVQSVSDRTFFKPSLMGSSFLTIIGIHSRHFHPHLCSLYCSHVGSLHRLCRYLHSDRKKQKEYRILHNWFIQISMQSTLTGITNYRKMLF